MRITLLGTGGSAGVPQIGCACAVCRSGDPRNLRSRASALIEKGGTTLLIDTSPDLRMQCLSNNINKLDAILYTHTHADHVSGIDDVRAFNALTQNIIPIYGDSATLHALHSRFSYAFSPPKQEGNGVTIWSKVCLQAHDIQNKDFFSVNDVSIRSFVQGHGKTTSRGYRIEDAAYSTDVDALDETAYTALEGIGLWVVDCLRYEPSPSHAHLERTLGWIDRLRPKMTVLTHMSHDIDYNTISKLLPEGVIAGYDGLRLERKENMWVIL